MDGTLSLSGLVTLIFVALAFDFLNGLHDAANSIATVVSTRVLRPQYAVIWAAFFNFIAFLFFGLHVAQTVGTGIVAAEVVDAAVIFGALMGAICWNVLTWWMGIPSSSSHALIGGFGRRGNNEPWPDRDRLERSRRHRGRHCSVATARLFTRFAACVDSFMGVRALDAIGRGQHLSHVAVGVGRALFSRAWRK
jgi:hypothetical protein